MKLPNRTAAMIAVSRTATSPSDSCTPMMAMAYKGGAQEAPTDFLSMPTILFRALAR